VTRRFPLGVEFAALFAVLPAAVALLLPGRPVLPVLWLAALGCAVALQRSRSFDRSPLWRLRAGGPGAGRALLVRVGAAALLLAAIARLALPASFLALPRERPALWLLILLLYPPLSVLPQGVVYRAFLFHRYAGLFPARALPWASAAAFAWMHVVFRNPWAVALTLAGGWMFAQTYRRTRSLLLSSLEHAVFGALVFTLGFGPFFFHGTARVARDLAGAGAGRDGPAAAGRPR